MASMTNLHLQRVRNAQAIVNLRGSSRCRSTYAARSIPISCAANRRALPLFSEEHLQQCTTRRKLRENGRRTVLKIPDLYAKLVKPL